MARILVVDDDDMIGYALKRACNLQGHEVEYASCFHAAEQAVNAVWDVIFLDIALPDGNGLALIPAFLAGPGFPEIIIITGYDKREWLENALNAGAWDYIHKEDTLDTILTALEQALLFHKNRQGLRASSEKIKNETTLFKRDSLVGQSVPFERCIELVASCAHSDICVLLTGETGTGKEVFARTIHENSSRHKGPFVTVDCASLPENLAESILFGHMRGAFTGASTRENGLITEADGGTLFLDEIGELPLSLQKIFLRVLQEKTVLHLGSTQEISCDFRLIAATNKDLELMVRENTFREDLFYRLQAVHIVLPPLRERQGDPHLLATHFCDHFTRLYDLPPKKFALGTQNIIDSYDWPGNVRELSGAMERAIITTGQGQVIFPQYLPTKMRIYVAGLHIDVKKEKIVDCEINTPFSPLTSVPNEIPSYAEHRKETWFKEEGHYLRRVLLVTQNSSSELWTVTGLSRSRLYALLKQHSLTG